MITFNVLSLGAGLQSSTLLEMSLLSKIPAYDLVTFADTGCEPSRVYKHVEYLQAKCLTAGVDFRIVRFTETGLLNDAKFGKFSTMPLYVLEDGKKSILKRQCTANYKIVPCDLEVRRFLQERGYAKTNKRGQIRVCPGVTVIKDFGISREEKRRMSEPSVRWQKFNYPLVDNEFDRLSCQKWLKAYGLPVPPKSSCIVCPYHSDDFWREIRDEYPSEFEEACSFDDFLRSGDFLRRSKFRGQLFIHPSCTPLRAAPLSGIEKPKQMSFMAELVFDRCSSDGGFSCFS